MPRGVYERKPKKTDEENTVAENETDETTPDTEPTPDPELTEGELCGQCWPAGWPGDGDAAECSHGTWQR
jgi:hypothetical protein